MSPRSILTSVLATTLIASSVAMVPLLTAAPAQAAVSYQVPWAPNGEVRAVAVDGSGTQYLGGDFTAMDLRAQGLAVLDPGASDWQSVDRTFPTVDDSVYAVVADGSGGWFVGGDFQKIGSPAVSQPYLAHVHADGSVDPDFITYLDGPVRALTLADGALYVGGSFTGYDTAVVALDATYGSAIGSFGLSSGTVTSLAVYPSGQQLDGAIVYVGGTFNAGSSDRHLMSFTCDINFNLCSETQGWVEPVLDADVRSLVLDAANGDLYVGGSFTSTNNDPNLGYLTRIDAANGTPDTAWTPSPDASVHALDLDTGIVYAGGEFTSVNTAASMSPVTRARLAAFDVTDPNGLPTPWDPSADGSVHAIDASGSSVFIGGAFQTAGGSPRPHIARLSMTTGAAEALTLEADGDVYSLNVDSSGSVALGGAFTSVGSESRARAAAVDGNGALTNWDPGAQSSVLAIAIVGSNVLLGGSFTWVGAPNAGNPYLALVDGATGAPASPSPVQVNGVVRALSVRASNVFVGGDFTSVTDGGGTVTRQRLARLTFSPSWSVDSWQADLRTSQGGGQVRALMWQSSTLYVGGDFTNFDGPSPASQAQNYAAAFDITTGALNTAWNPNPNGPVNALAYSGWSQTVFLGGEFTTLAGSTSRSYAGAVADANTWTGAAASNVRAWNPQPNAVVHALLYSGIGGGANILMGGAFTNVTTYSRAGLAAVTAEGMGGARSWNPLAAQQASTVRALGIWNGILVGGLFTSGTQPGAVNYVETERPRSEPGPMQYSPTSFGVVPVGSPTILTVVAINRSGFMVTPNSVTVTGPGLTLLGSCIYQPISSNAACAITVSWTPGSAGSLTGASLSMTFTGSPPDSAPSTTVLTGLAATPAAAPTGLTATSANGSADIAFTPGADGGSSITNYEYNLDGTGWTAASPDDTTSPVTITGLTNGTAYSIQLRAVTGLGGGTASSPVSVTPLTTASAPTGLNATPANQSADIAFTAGSNGGSPITNYQYTLDDSTWIPLSPDDTVSPVTIPGLVNGTTYAIKLRALTAAGNGAPSTAVSVTPGDPTPTPGPQPPQPAPSLTPASQSLRAVVGVPVAPTTPLMASHFTLPPRFTVYPALPVGLVLDQSMGVVSGTARAASPSTRHWITATAGFGSESATSTLDLVVTATVPDPPTGVVGLPGDRSVTATWAAPITDGGAPVTDYEVMAAPGGATCLTAATERTCTISNLANGTAYSLKVRARNSLGWSSWSVASEPVTPQSDPAIVITGARSTTGRSIIITGVATGVPGKYVTPWLRLAGQRVAKPQTPARLSEDGTFTWRRKTPRKAQVHVTVGMMSSNTIVVAARR